MSHSMYTRDQQRRLAHIPRTLDGVDGGVDLLDAWDGESTGLSGAVLGAGQNAAAGQGHWNGLFLNGGGLFVAQFEDAHEQLALQHVVLEVVAFCPRHVLPAAVRVGGEVSAARDARKPRLALLTSVRTRLSAGGRLSFAFHSSLVSSAAASVADAGALFSSLI